uniref:KANL3/Tex30 alpha/beta hydrolase-like domain-containing protein n=1 Tax=Salix viminalis TaxID=40686 RepID=A0A6N2M7E9_SALVM
MEPSCIQGCSSHVCCISILGGCQGLLKGIAVGLAGKGYKAVTFDMRGAGKSTGRASLTGFAEIKDVIAVCKWVCENLSSDRILLVGSSAGAPIAGSAVDEIKEVVGYVSIGYPFGMFASILFGRHHKAVLNSQKPKLFVMGTRDGFTSVKQLQHKLSSAVGRVETHLIEGASHFQMEGPEFDNQMVDLILPFISSL